MKRHVDIDKKPKMHARAYYVMNGNCRIYDFLTIVPLVLEKVKLHILYIFAFVS